MSDWKFYPDKDPIATAPLITTRLVDFLDDPSGPTWNHLLGRAVPIKAQPGSPLPEETWSYFQLISDDDAKLAQRPIGERLGRFGYALFDQHSSAPDALAHLLGLHSDPRLSDDAYRLTKDMYAAKRKKDGGKPAAQAVASAPLTLPSPLRGEGKGEGDYGAVLLGAVVTVGGIIKLLDGFDKALADPSTSLRTTMRGADDTLRQVVKELQNLRDLATSEFSQALGTNEGAKFWETLKKLQTAMKPLFKDKSVKESVVQEITGLVETLRSQATGIARAIATRGSGVARSSEDIRMALDALGRPAATAAVQAMAAMPATAEVAAAEAIRVPTQQAIEAAVTELPAVAPPPAPAAAPPPASAATPPPAPATTPPPATATTPPPAPATTPPPAPDAKVAKATGPIRGFIRGVGSRSFSAARALVRAPKNHPVKTAFLVGAALALLGIGYVLTSGNEEEGW